jgi:hypothetical protein
VVSLRDSRAFLGEEYVMSLKIQSLGSIGGNVRGIVATGGTNATPIVVTLTAGHGLKNGDRIAITGVTGLTGMNGEWTVSAAAATRVTLDGSAGNGVFGGTPVISVLCDKTPFLPRHSAVARINSSGTGVTVAPIVTVAINSSADNVTFATAVEGPTGVPAITATGYGVMVEVSLKKYMEAIGSAWTSGTVTAQLLARVRSRFAWRGCGRLSES